MALRQVHVQVQVAACSKISHNMLHQDINTTHILVISVITFGIREVPFGHVVDHSRGSYVVPALLQEKCEHFMHCVYGSDEVMPWCTHPMEEGVHDGSCCVD